MLGIELSTGTKIQIGLVVLILGAAGVMLLRNSRPQLNDAVNSWITVEKQFKAGTNNREWDPVKEATVNTFTCADGKLFITEYKNDPTKATNIRWQVDPRRTEFLYYRDPMARVKAIKDPYKHAIALAAYSAAAGSRLGFLDNVGLTDEQKTAVLDAGKLMNDELEINRGAVDNGTFKASLYEAVLKTLAEYKKVKGNPLESKEKADAARKVIITANEYLNAVEDARSASIEKYIAKITSVLNNDQKTKVAEVGKNYEAARAPRTASAAPAGRRTAPNVPASAPAARATTPTGARTRPVTPNTNTPTPRTAPPAPTPTPRIAPPAPAAG